MSVRLFSLEVPPEPDGDWRRLPAWPWPRALRYPLAAPALRRELAGFAPDLVDAHYVPNYGILGALAGRRPLVIHSWGSDLLVSAQRSRWHAARARWALGRADRVFADARVLGEAAVALGVPRARIEVVPWGIELERFPLGAFVEEPRLVSVRHLEPIYDVTTLVEALPEIAAGHPDLGVEIAGEGPERAALEARARTLGVADRARFRGRVSPAELARLVAASAVYVSTSRSDSTSLSLLEAMAAGSVPVVTDIPGNREWIEPGVGGRLFPVGDARALARAVSETLADAEFRRRARLVNRRAVEERGDWAKSLARVSGIYAALAGKAA